MTRDVVKVWHVFADGEWMTVEYAGYAPVNVWVGERLCPVKYRHMASTRRSECGACG